MGIINLEKFQTLAKRYTTALISSAKKDNQVEEIANELTNIIKTFNENKNIENFFTNPIIKKEDKKDVLEQTFKKNINDKLYNLLNILVDKGRMYILPNIEFLYKQELDKEANIIDVTVQSVIELNDEMKNLLNEKLSKITNKKIRLKNVINKEIIGGLIISFEGKVIDGSVKSQLKNLQKQLI